MTTSHNSCVVYFILFEFWNSPIMCIINLDRITNNNNAGIWISVTCRRDGLRVGLFIFQRRRI